MNQFFNNKKLIVLLISVITFLSIIAFSLTNNRENTSIIQKVGNDITGIAARILAKPAEAVENFVDSTNRLMNTYEENQALKSKIDTLYELQVQVYDLQIENEKMQQELGLKSTLSDFQTVSATVISRNPDNWLNQIIIDKGSQDGIEVNMSVMSGNGMIGRVSEVSATSAKILLLSSENNDSNRVAAEIQTKDTAVHGIVYGYDSETGNLIMNQINPDAKVEAGDKVVTSGLGGVSPSSLYIGTIESIEMDRYGLFQEASIKPAGELQDIRYVTVVERVSGSDE